MGVGEVSRDPPFWSYLLRDDPPEHLGGIRVVRRPSNRVHELVVQRIVVHVHRLEDAADALGLLGEEEAQAEHQSLHLLLEPCRDRLQRAWGACVRGRTSRDLSPALASCTQAPSQVGTLFSSRTVHKRVLPRMHEGRAIRGCSHTLLLLLLLEIGLEGPCRVDQDDATDELGVVSRKGEHDIAPEGVADDDGAFGLFVAEERLHLVHPDLAARVVDDGLVGPPEA